MEGSGRAPRGFIGDTGEGGPSVQDPPFLPLLQVDDLEPGPTSVKCDNHNSALASLAEHKTPRSPRLFTFFLSPPKADILAEPTHLA